MDTATILELSSQLTAINISLQKIAISFQNQSFHNTQLFAAIIGAIIGLSPSIYLLWKDNRSQ